MKKIFGLIAALLLIAGCDDGDMSYKSFDFTGKTIVSCEVTESGSQTYYKINGTEGLVLVLSQNALINKSTLDPVTKEHVPYIITLSNTNTLTYQNFVSTPGPNGLCTLAGTPATTETWNGVGTLSVVTEAIKEGSEDEGYVITGYAHVITIQNVSFKNGDETITINNNLFGRIDKNYGFDFDFIIQNNEPNVETCPNIVTNFIYTVKNTELLALYFENLAATFPEIEGNVQQIQLGNNNNLVFTKYDGTLTSARFCPSINEPEPTTPQPIQRWTTTPVDADNAMAIITTSLEVNQYVHDIRLKDVILTNTTTGEKINLSDIAKKDEDGYYYYGKYRP